jgi:hypothetical protein
MTKFYNVLYGKGGDIFKGYQTGLVSQHLDKQIAEQVAERNSGWVEEDEDELHESFIEHLKKNDAKFKKG